MFHSASKSKNGSVNQTVVILHYIQCLAKSDNKGILTAAAVWRSLLWWVKNNFILFISTSNTTRFFWPSTPAIRKLASVLQLLPQGRQWKVPHTPLEGRICFCQPAFYGLRKTGQERKIHELRSSLRWLMGSDFPGQVIGGWRKEKLYPNLQSRQTLKENENKKEAEEG